MNSLAKTGEVAMIPVMIPKKNALSTEVMVDIAVDLAKKPPEVSKVGPDLTSGMDAHCSSSPTDAGSSVPSTG